MDQFEINGTEQVIKISLFFCGQIYRGACGADAGDCFTGSRELPAASSWLWSRRSVGGSFFHSPLGFSLLLWVHGYACLALSVAMPFRKCFTILTVTQCVWQRGDDVLLCK